MEKLKQYAYWLCSIPSVGNRSIKKLLECCHGNPMEVYLSSEALWKSVLREKQAEQMKIAKERWDVVGEYEKLREKKIGFLTPEEQEYPGRLRNIPDAPYGIFYKGKLPEEDRLSVAIIGARDCSDYGRYVAAGLGEFLGQKGVQIISGMARGIDGISQEAALQVGGISIGVPGCGPDICYPAGNRRLYEKLVEQGGILSIYLPGEEPKPQNFPRRNAIVSGLADVVVVVEAREKSGTLITVDMALEQGRDVYVVPGRITDRLSDGCNNLLKQGAGIVLSPGDFYEEIYAAWQERRSHQETKSYEGKGGYQEAEPYQRDSVFEATGESLKGRQKNKMQINKGQNDNQKQEGMSYERKCLASDTDLGRVYETLDFYPKSIEQIQEKLPGYMSYIQVNTLLMQLCIEGYATQISTGYFCLGNE